MRESDHWWAVHLYFAFTYNHYSCRENSSEASQSTHVDVLFFRCFPLRSAVADLAKPVWEHIIQTGRYDSCSLGRGLLLLFMFGFSPLVDGALSDQAEIIPYTLSGWGKD